MRFSDPQYSSWLLSCLTVSLFFENYWTLSTADAGHGTTVISKTNSSSGASVTGRDGRALFPRTSTTKAPTTTQPIHKSPMAIAAESRRRSRTRGDAALFADWTAGLESSAGNRTLPGMPVALPQHGVVSPTVAVKADTPSRRAEQEFPALQVAESHVNDVDDEDNRAAREDPAFGDGHNLGYKPSAGESGSYTGDGYSSPVVDSAQSSGSEARSYENGLSTGYAAQASSNGNYEDYGKSDYYNKPSYQPESSYSGWSSEGYGSGSGCCGGGGGGGYDNQKTVGGVK